MVALLEKYVIPNSENKTLDGKIEVIGCFGVERCGRRKAYRMGNEEDRDNHRLKELMMKHPDWDWDYWEAQVA